jgi:hypothetical protein
MSYQRIVPHREPPHSCILPASFDNMADDVQLQRAVAHEAMGYVGQLTPVQSQYNVLRKVADPPEPGTGTIWACDACGRKYVLHRGDGGQIAWVNSG